MMTPVCKIVNRGTGAGGSNTNKNGLSYEKLTDLKSEYNIQSANRHSNEIIFKKDHKNTIFISTKQSNLFKYMTEHIKQILFHLFLIIYS